MSPYAKNFTLIHRSPSLSRKSISFGIFKKPLILNIILIIFISFLLIFYLIEVNQIITFSFKLKELEKKKEELKEINKNLELEKIKLESLNNTQNYLNSLGLIKIEKVEYIKSLTSATLTKK